MIVRKQLITLQECMQEPRAIPVVLNYAIAKHAFPIFRSIFHHNRLILPNGHERLIACDFSACKNFFSQKHTRKLA